MKRPLGLAERLEASVAPSRGRGLKLGVAAGVHDAAGRPLTGARIETYASPASPPGAPSPPHGGAD